MPATRAGHVLDRPVQVMQRRHLAGQRVLPVLSLVVREHLICRRPFLQVRRIKRVAAWRVGQQQRAGDNKQCRAVSDPGSGH